MVELEEQQIVEEAQRDPARFADLYDRHFDRVYAFVARRVRDRHVAEDLTSEVFHHALADLPRFEWRGAPFGAWLMRIAANAIADHWKSQAQAKQKSEELAHEPADIPADEMEAADERAHLFRHVRRLPAEQRLVIVGRFVKEKSIREIAQELGKSEGAVKQLQLRSLETLRQRMGEAHD
jgi:RNA polymerase sigma-70 factor (ECF subfamily)